MTTYTVHISDVAQAEIEAEVFRLIGILGPESAAHWQAGLLIAMEELTFMPYRNAIAESDAPAYPDLELRRMLFGKGRMVYRILYHVIEPVEDETEGTIHILRVRYAAMRPLGESGDA